VLVGYVALAVTCILLTGSRSGFVGLSALAMIVVLLSKRRATILLLLAIAAPVAWTLLPKDRQDRYLTIIDPSYGPKNAEESATGRTKGWWDGVMLWKEHPVLGVGPDVFGLATGSGFQSHELYGQVLGELGTMGAIAFGAVVLCLFGNYLEMRRLSRQEPEFRDSFSARLIQSVTITIFLLLLMGLASYNLYRFNWLWFGAFQAVALYCMRVAQPATALVFVDVAGDGSAKGAFI
jgi:O-antigen ligase